MKNTIKSLLVGAALVLPLASFAGEVKPVTPQPVAKAEQKSGNTQLALEGAKLDNTAEIVKLAKEAGAAKASFNAKTNMLTLSGNKFNKEKFTSSLSSSLPGVSVKN